MLIYLLQVKGYEIKKYISRASSSFPGTCKISWSEDIAFTWKRECLRGVVYIVFTGNAQLYSVVVAAVVVVLRPR